MIQPLFNGMLTILLAKFVINDLPHVAGLLESRNPESLTGVWFDTPKIRAEVESTTGLLDFVGSTLQKLKQKYSTGPKRLGFAELEPDILAVLVFSDIIIHVAVVDMWAADEALTRKALSYVLPHEFGHYMMMSGHVKVPLPKGPKWKEARREWKETYADELAERESGMSREEANEVTAAIGRKMLGEES